MGDPTKISRDFYRLDPERNAALAADYKAGATMPEVCKRYRVGHYTVYKILADFGISPRRQGSRALKKAGVELRAQIGELKAKGKKNVEIARLIERTPSAVSRLLRTPAPDPEA